MNNKMRKIIFTATYLAYTSIYIARVNLSVAGPELISANIMDTVQIGLLGSVFSSVFAIGRLLNGQLNDKTPPWIMLAIGLVFSGLSNIFVGFFPPFIGIFISWSVNAYAQSMLWGSVLCTVSSIYDKDEAKKKISLMVTSVAMGNILAIVLNTFLITRFGTKFAFIVPGIITIVLGGIICFTARDIKPDANTPKKYISLWKLLKNKELLFMSIPGMFHGIMKENISLWMAVYIVDKFSVDLSTSSYYILLIPVIGFIGRTIYPITYKLCKNSENTVSLLGFGLCIAASLLLIIGNVGVALSVIALSVIYAAASMINTSILSIYPLHYTKTGNVASVSGIMDFSTYLGAGIASVIYGAVIKHFGYLPMFLSWAVISVISILAILKIDFGRKKV